MKFWKDVGGSFTDVERDDGRDAAQHAREIGLEGEAAKFVRQASHRELLAGDALRRGHDRPPPGRPGRDISK